MGILVRNFSVLLFARRVHACESACIRRLPSGVHTMEVGAAGPAVDYDELPDAVLRCAPPSGYSSQVDMFECHTHHCIRFPFHLSQSKRPLTPVAATSMCTQKRPCLERSSIIESPRSLTLHNDACGGSVEGFIHEQHTCSAVQVHSDKAL